MSDAPQTPIPQGPTHKGPLPDHIRPNVFVETEGGYAVTNDRAALGEYEGYAHSFEKAWRIFGTLVYHGLITVNFADPEWATQVRLFVESIAQETTVMMLGA